MPASYGAHREAGFRLAKLEVGGLPVELFEYESAKIFLAAGLNAEYELPPLPVLSTRSPLSVVRMQVELVAQRIDINCFISDPSVKSSLKFLRKTPWARARVEELYLGTKFSD